MTDNRNLITDPLTTLGKIALLYFMPAGTKIAIHNNILYIQSPSNLQWISRKIYGDNRMEIANLNVPIIKAIKWYILDGDEKINMDENMSDGIKIITNFAIKGLKKMQKETYMEDISIKIILQYLINILENAINDSWDEKFCVDDNNEKILSNKIRDDYDSQIIKSISVLLSDTDNINIKINELLNESDKINNNNNNRRDINFQMIGPNINNNKISEYKNNIYVWIECAQRLLENRDKNFVKLIENN